MFDEVLNYLVSMETLWIEFVSVNVIVMYIVIVGVYSTVFSVKVF